MVVPRWTCALYDDGGEIGVVEDPAKFLVVRVPGARRSFFTHCLFSLSFCLVCWLDAGHPSRQTTTSRFARVARRPRRACSASAGCARWILLLARI